MNESSRLLTSIRPDWLIGSIEVELSSKISNQSFPKADLNSTDSIELFRFDRSIEEDSSLFIIFWSVVTWGAGQLPTLIYRHSDTGAYLPGLSYRRLFTGTQLPAILIFLRSFTGAQYEMHVFEMRIRFEVQYLGP